MGGSLADSWGQKPSCQGLRRAGAQPVPSTVSQLLGQRVFCCSDQPYQVHLMALTQARESHLPVSSRQWSQGGNFPGSPETLGCKRRKNLTEYTLLDFADGPTVEPLGLPDRHIRLEEGGYCQSKSPCAGMVAYKWNPRTSLLEVEPRTTLHCS